MFSGSRSVAFPSQVPIAGVVLAFLVTPLAAQPVMTDVFPVAEHAARRTRVMQSIGDGLAILQATTERPGEQPMRQSNQFHYLTGVVQPRAILVIDGRTKRSTLFLNRASTDRANHFRAFVEPIKASALQSRWCSVVSVGDRLGRSDDLVGREPLWRCARQ